MRRFLCCLAALAIIATGAAAKQPELDLSPLMVLPMPDTPVGESIVAGRGKPVMAALLRYEETASLRSPRSVNVHGLFVPTTRETYLRQAKVADPGFYGLEQASRVYCRTRQELSDEQLTQTITVKGRSRAVKAFKPVVTLCFIDQDGSGRFSRAFVDGAAHPATERAIAIEPVEYSRETRRHPWDTVVVILPIPTDSPNEFYLDIYTNISSGLFNPTSLAFRKADGSSGKFANFRRVLVKDLPLTVRYQDAEITLLSFEHWSSSLRYRIEKPLSSAQVKLVVDDKTEGKSFIFN
jgi:hypothetical protein